MPNYEDVIIYGDQPTTCPRCGVRTKILLDLSHTKYSTQVHACINISCSKEFVTQSDYQIRL